MSFDSTLAALEVQREFWRRLGPEGRVRLAVEMSERHTYYGEPRATQDVDMVIDPTNVACLGSRAANSPRACGRPATTTRHSARPLADALGLQARSERQLRDVEAIVRATGDSLDRGYLLTWATELGVEGAVRRVLG